MSKFLKGTLVLMAATLIVKILGFVNRIVIARLIGEEGVGLYMMVFPSFILVVTLTQMGLPVAISRSVAAAEARGDIAKMKRILAVSLSITLSLSLLFTPALLLMAPYLSKTLFTDPRTYYPLIAITPAIPVIAVSSVLRGYFQGRQNMKPAAYSQVLEQVVRIGLIALFTKQMLPHGIEYAAAGAMAAATCGELISLLYLLLMFRFNKTFLLRRRFFRAIRTGKETAKELFEVALPTTGSRLIGSLGWFFEPIVVTQSLAIAGVTAVVATKQYGVLTGYALPVMFLPSFVTLALSTSLVPAVSEAYAKKQYRLLEHRVQEALRFCLVTGGLSVLLLFLYAEPLMQFMYHSTNGARFIVLMAPFFLFYYYQGPLQAVLQALNLANAAMINSLIGVSVKLAVIFIFASQPQFGIYGAALGMAASILLVTLLHLATVFKKITLTLNVHQYAKFSFVMIASFFISRFLNGLFLDKAGSFTYLAAGAAASALCYFLLSLLLGLITKKDLSRMPLIKRFIK
ncbi:stage V sporulation protein B [Bacillus badius]|uniref:stage V sporulation protein B n=1 Tax=Bacillus badius TaxID=1455 RepID=UPI0007B08D61|nr:stage V sporulation protein B [Bacillus badius]KZN98716.1 stage V sporulation protein B [Bacillus badius]MED0666294.1 stage V sporulation protein B [Bacillus badius]OCS83654.1 stage V sporulation protein B [Bacillus badius]OVE53059.1 stage V sporulation protein B [Bacillus badius]TDW05102.1 stage V sporulation protein B [Bacillus badius]